MARRRRRKSRALKGAAASCPRPTYGRTLGGTVIGDVITGVFVVGGMFGGAAFAKSRESDPTSMEAGKKILLGGIAGGAVGGLASIYPSLLADRRTIKGPGCSRASIGRLFVSRFARAGAIGAAAAGVNALPLTGRTAAALYPAVTAVGLLATVPLTQAIIRT